MWSEDGHAGRVTLPGGEPRGEERHAGASAVFNKAH